MANMAGWFCIDEEFFVGTRRALRGNHGALQKVTLYRDGALDLCEMLEVGGDWCVMGCILCDGDSARLDRLSD